MEAHTVSPELCLFGSKLFGFSGPCLDMSSQWLASSPLYSNCIALLLHYIAH